ncbi:MAG TPA: hypothetical protein VJI69_02230 [Bacteroidia bacterium]|nr:hypothetical protein [Bacteroidia bacterium]
MSKRHIFFLISFVLITTKLSAFIAGDSTKKVKPPKHYFNKTLYFDYYSTGKRELDTINQVSKVLGSYQLSQVSMGYTFPMVTRDIYNKDSTKISTLNLLFTGNYSSLKLNFEGIDKHNLTKLSLGCRGFYSNGKKSIFFVELSPFVTQDRGYAYTKTYRLASTVLYNFTANEYFSFRVGYTRSFLWGNRYQLPYVGIRVGKLDKTNFSVQFPRGATLNIPIGKFVRTSLYTKPQGGLYTFANTDSLKIGSLEDNDKLYFGRYEFLSGLRLDVQPSNFFNFYVSSGFTTRNKIAFFSTTLVKDNTSTYKNYYSENIKGSIFVNFGLVFRFGRTKSTYNNSLMYDMKDLNNTVAPGDSGVNNGNGDIPVPANKIKKVNTDEILDLIEAQDLY